MSHSNPAIDPANPPGRRIGALALIRDDENKVLLVKPTYKEGWILPGGGAEADESVHAAATGSADENGVQVLLHGLEQPVGHVLSDLRVCDPDQRVKLLGIHDTGHAAHNIARGIGHAPTGLGMNAFPEQPAAGHDQPSLLLGLTDGGGFGGLAFLDLTGWELPRQLPLLHPPANHQDSASVGHDRGGDARALFGSLLRHVWSSKAARIGGKSVSTEMKRVRAFLGTHITSTFSTASLLVASPTRYSARKYSHRTPVTGCRRCPSEWLTTQWTPVSSSVSRTAVAPARAPGLITPAGNCQVIPEASSLLCGLYQPDADGGRVLWGDVDTREANRTQLFARVAMVAQDFYRWPFTARVNIGIGRSDRATHDAAIEAAAAYAGADEVLAKLPRGLSTLLARGYKGGHQISGGQWQRFGIARARFRDADVLIVDEPTSALDAVAEQRVFDQIRNLAGQGQTIILITHRLHSVRHADLIYVMHEGSVAESGTFDELMDPATGTGAFRDAYLLQSRAYEHTIPAQQSEARDGETVGGSA